MIHDWADREGRDPGHFRLGADIKVEPSRCRIIRNGELLSVEPRVMALLVHLSERPGQIVSKTDLMREIWRANVVDEAVHRAVSLLRRALGDSADDPRLIETVPRQGYRLLVEPNRTSRAPTGGALGWALASAVAILLVVILASWDFEAPSSAAPGQSRAPMLPTPAAPVERAAQNPDTMAARNAPSQRAIRAEEATPRALPTIDDRTAPLAPTPQPYAGRDLRERTTEPTASIPAAPEAPKADD